MKVVFRVYIFIFSFCVGTAALMNQCYISFVSCVCENTMLPLGSKTNFSWEALVSLGSTNNLISVVRSACLFVWEARCVRPHDIVTPTDFAKINQVRSKLSLRNGNWIFWKIKRFDKPPLIPWKYEVNTLKCILPLSWCIQMGSDI